MEVIVALGVFAVLASAVASIALDSLRTAGDNRERVRASSLAAEEVERVRAQFRSSPASIAANCLTRPNPVTVGTERYTLACASSWLDAARQPGPLVNAATAGAVLRVEVSVRWPALGLDRPAVISTTVLS